MVNNLEVSTIKLRQNLIQACFFIVATLYNMLMIIQPEEKKSGFAKLKEAREKIKDQIKNTKEKNYVFGAGKLYFYVIYDAR